MTSFQETDPVRPFNLKRWFALLAFLCITLVSMFSAYLLTRFLTQRMIERDSEVTADFVQSITQAEKADRYFLDPKHVEQAATLESFFRHIATIPEVLRFNAYARDGTVVWSSDRSLIGRRFGQNPELDEALAGEVVVHSDLIGREIHAKAEHEKLGSDAREGHFVENYIPVRSAPGAPVVGVVEMYRTPHSLFETLHQGRQLIWISAASGAVFLYLALFWVVRRAQRIMETQQQQILEAETLAVVGEMSSAVAHSIRNPIASIRTTAELALDAEPEMLKESAEDIIRDVDRVEQCVRDLLTYSRPLETGQLVTEVNPVLRESLAGFAREAERQGSRLELDLAEGLPQVKGDPGLLRQVFNSVLSNAFEALQPGGRVAVSSALTPERREVLVTIADSGCGMRPDQLQQVFKPFFTTKRRGMGLGLALVRRIVKRFGGHVAIQSAPGEGTRVLLRFSLIE